MRIKKNPRDFQKNKAVNCFKEIFQKGDEIIEKEITSLIPILL